nr:hypothetical protein [Nostoc sp. EkiNYC01]
MTNQIFVVIADGSQREWTDAEKHLVSQSPELIEQLLVWLENSLSDIAVDKTVRTYTEKRQSKD